jgi:hypothetical protein
MVVVIFIAIGFLIVVGVIRKLKKRRQRRRRW